jgi:carboxyl-terminal processing protease
MDLRQNGGGHLSEATELSGLFIDRGPIVQLKETGGTINVLPDPSETAAYSGPLAVLVNRYSASASEIFAAAIQDYERGIVIGQTTFGKGTVQNLFALERAGIEGQLTLTIGKYYRVTGESTQHRGVIPDIELPSGVDEEVVGESTRPTALPFDRIGPTDFRSRSSLDSEIDLLSIHHVERASADPDFRFLLNNIAAAEELDAQKTVSLNYAARVAERERLEKATLDRENARRSALGLQALATVAELTSEEVDDVADPAAIVLRQAARVVGEMIALDGTTPPRTRDLLLSGGATSPAAAAPAAVESR